MLRDALTSAHADSAPSASLSQREDAVRLAAVAAPEITGRLAAGCGLTSVQLRAAVRAWESGGAAGLSVWDEPWAPGPEAMARARGQLAQAWAEEDAPPALHVRDNRWTTADGRVQLRHSRDGRWWPYRDEQGTWWPAGGPERDPAAALAVALENNEPGRGERS
jgi:hypothetical protein